MTAIGAGGALQAGTDDAVFRKVFRRLTCYLGRCKRVAGVGALPHNAACRYRTGCAGGQVLVAS